MKKSKQLLALSLAAIMTAGMLTGCGKAEKPAQTQQEATDHSEERDKGGDSGGDFQRA